MNYPYYPLFPAGRVHMPAGPIADLEAGDRDKSRLQERPDKMTRGINGLLVEFVKNGSETGRLAHIPFLSPFPLVNPPDVNRDILRRPYTVSFQTER